MAPAAAMGTLPIARPTLWAASEFCLREPGAAARGAELAQHLFAYWSSRGQFGDLRRMFMALASLTPDDSAPRAHYLRAAAVMADGRSVRAGDRTWCGGCRYQRSAWRGVGARLHARGHLASSLARGRQRLAEVEARAGAATKHVIDDCAGLQLLLETLAWMAAEGGVHARAAIVLVGRARAHGQRPRPRSASPNASWRSHASSRRR